MKFSLGETVTSRKIGPPAVGTIVGVYEGSYYNCISDWEKFYPDWKDKSVYFVYYEPAIRPCTEQEFYEDPNHVYYEKYEDVPVMSSLAYPEDDLEPF